MNKILTYILVGLLIAAGLYILYLRANPEVETKYVTRNTPPEIEYITKPSGGVIAQIPVQYGSEPSQTLSEGYVKYVNDTLVPALDKGLKYKAQLTELTRINGLLKDSLSKKNVVLSTVKRDVIEWKTKYITIAANPKDSTVKYAYDAQIDVTEYERRESLFGAKKPYIAVTSPDKNLKINGMENYTKALRPSKDFLELNLQVQGLVLNRTVIPYGGAELVFNPDGKLKPIAGGGYFYDHISGRFYPYWSIGAQFNLIRF